MTETIGWGDVDVDITPPRRRRVRSWPWWAALVAVVAGVALAPSARARLAGSSAAWLARTWSTAQAYDTSRTATEEHALERASAADVATYARVVSMLDREEASRLRALTRDVEAHRTWAGDVHAAAVAVRRALVSEAHDLDADAGRTSMTFRSDLYLETATQYATQSLQLTAQRSVEQLVRRHHLRMPLGLPATSRLLSSATALIQQLDRVTDEPVDLRLAIGHDGALDMWDLATGKSRLGVAQAAADSADLFQPVIRVGNGVLFATGDGFQVVRAGGGRQRLAAPSSTQFVSAGDGSVWATYDGLWRRYDGSGRPVGPQYRTPAGYSDSPIAGTSDSVVIFKDSPYGGTQAEVWTPSTGHLTPLPGSCDAAITGARAAIAYVGCDQLSVSVMDRRSGRVRTVHTPPGTVVDEAGMALSPDGTRLAFGAGELNGDETKSSLVLLDARSGRMTVIAHGTSPLCWSPDGSTLLVSSDVGDNVYSKPLGYWRDGMTRPAPIRIPLTHSSVPAVLLS